MMLNKGIAPVQPGAIRGGSRCASHEVSQMTGPDARRQLDGTPTSPIRRCRRQAKLTPTCDATLTAGPCDGTVQRSPAATARRTRLNAHLLAPAMRGHRWRTVPNGPLWATWRRSLVGRPYVSLAERLPARRPFTDRSDSDSVLWHVAVATDDPAPVRGQLLFICSASITRMPLGPRT